MREKVFLNGLKNIYDVKMESEKYNKIIKLLRESKPVLDSTEDIEREVLRHISGKHESVLNLSELLDSLFGWIYIGWVRRTLITASVLLVVVFVWQQSIILKQINYLSRQTILTDREESPDPVKMLERKLLMYKIPGRKFSSPSITITEKQMKQLLDSVNALQIKYKDLMNLIEEDPELKKYIENKLIENNRSKIKL
jgi:hypothetical protein